MCCRGSGGPAGWWAEFVLEGEETGAEPPMGFALGRTLTATGRRHDSERSLKNTHITYIIHTYRSDLGSHTTFAVSETDHRKNKQVHLNGSMRFTSGYKIHKIILKFSDASPGSSSGPQRAFCEDDSRGTQDALVSDSSRLWPSGMDAF